MLAGSDFDFFLIDTQHSQIDITTLYTEQMLTDLGRSKEVIVRIGCFQRGSPVPFNETYLVNAAIDASPLGCGRRHRAYHLTNTPEAHFSRTVEMLKAIQADGQVPAEGRNRSWAVGLPTYIPYPPLN